MEDLERELERWGIDWGDWAWEYGKVLGKVQGDFFEEDEDDFW